MESSWIDGFEKELKASQQIFSPHQLFEYDELFDIDPEMPIAPSWRDRSRTVAMNLSRILANLRPIYPKINRTKSVSRETAELYLQRYPDRDLTSITTKDLEVHNYRTGEEIQGGCEMRAAWRFNELKPRIYYAQGGRDYHRSKYMKPIAVAFMEAFDMTSLQNRGDPTSKLNENFDPAMWVTAWDLSSFTTNLSELKYFLYYTSRLLEEFRFVETVPIISYAVGRLDIPPWDLLDRYNEDVNQNSPFSIYRILDRFGLDGDQPFQKQQNSGMLGVPGNIGFSTSLHGVIAAKALGPDYAVCVGDDAIGISFQPPEENLIPHIEHLGSIAREKFSIIPPGQGGSLKFLKRRLDVEYDFLSLSSLFMVPIFPTIDGEIPELRTPPLRFEWKDRLYGTITHVGKLLWDVFENAYLLESDEEFLLLKILLDRIYRRMGIPRRGGLPGTIIKYSNQPDTVLNIAIPSLYFDLYDPRAEDWAEFLWTSEPSRFYSLPVLIPYEIPLKKEQDGFVTRGPVIRLLEDIGCIETHEEWEMLESFGIDNHRRFRAWLKRENRRSYPLLSYRVIGPFPEWVREQIYMDHLEVQNTYGFGITI